jgi:hypothetical protein
MTGDYCRFAIARDRVARIGGCAPSPRRAHSRRHFRRIAMRASTKLAAAVVLALSVMSGCTPYIPVKDDFGTSAVVPAGDTPPEFAEFNVYNPQVNQLLADQYCATPYQPLDDKSVAASTGRLVQARGRCQTHIPLIGQ